MSASWRVFSILALVLANLAVSRAEPASLPFSDCTSGPALPASQKINITSVYGQIVTNDELGKHLNLTAIGETGSTIIPVSNVTLLQATMFTTSSVLSFSIWSNRTFFCSTLRPPSPLPSLPAGDVNYYCPLDPGPLAFSATVPFNKHQYELFTINTRLRIVDTSQPAVELACIDVASTPLMPGEEGRNIYGRAIIIFWTSVVLAVAYWVVVGLARIVAAWGRGGRTGRGIWTSIESTGYVLASAISGELLAVTPALMRFGTPSMRDIIFHTQWCAALSMVAVQWPVFVYPFFAQTAWATLSYNITLTQGDNSSLKHWNPLAVPEYNPPSNFADQLADPTSPIFVDSSAPNALLMLPANTSSGLASFAAIVGIRQQDLFGIAASLFCLIIAGTIVISVVIMAIDWVVCFLYGSREKRSSLGSTSPPSFLSSSKGVDKVGTPLGSNLEGHASTNLLYRTSSVPLQSFLGGRWRTRFRTDSFHLSVLHGNLVRILILFHLPLTIFSCYQFTLGRETASLASIILAVFAFTLFSIAMPISLVYRLSTTATSKLYDETHTLLMLGPLYNHYGHGSQLFACLFFATNLAYGITIGCGQRSGTVQAIIILILEVASSLGTSVWLPWGQGASMGLISFFFCVARITIAVLLVILTPLVSVGNAAGGWVATAVMFILGLIYLAFILILVTKLVEVFIRIVWKVPFDRTKYTIDSGLLGVLGLIGCCGPRKRRDRRRRRSGDTGVATNRSSLMMGSQQFQPRASTPGGGSTGGPPSVLRPEQAFRPYREDSDDESGYIMGSWQPFPRQGYSPVDNPGSPATETPPQQQPSQQTPKSGFARVGGGRAHFESPYAISSLASTSTPPNATASAPRQQFPSVERNIQVEALPPPPVAQFEAAASASSNNPSTISVNHQVTSGLPPGAMSPTSPSVHVRTKSQTAIIEHTSALYSPFANASGESGSQSDQAGMNIMEVVPQNAIVDDDEDSDERQPRRNWFMSKIRRFSEGNNLSVSGSSLQETGLLQDDPQSQPQESGRSFMVLRDKKASPAKSDPTRPSSLVRNEPSNDSGRRSFVVLRGE